MFSRDDTIVAIATPPGRGGLGVVRISGTGACAIARAILDHDAPLSPRHATFTRVRAVDQVIATYFPGPHSYTGEDVVELSGHGSPVLLRGIVEAASAAGARLAEPGEFTFRAYLNDRIDLVQAEAVADLIDAVTPRQARTAFDQLEGTLTQAICRIHRDLFDLEARLEASLDFPDEGYHFVEASSVAGEIRAVVAGVDRLLTSATTGRLVREGGQVAIVGKVNVGKSSIFNSLLGCDRAIVTPIPGTTRDLLVETVDIHGLALALIDTAGSRVTADAIESEGISRARGARSVAQLIMVVLDRSRPLEADDHVLLQETAGCPRLIVVNKVDAPKAWDSQSVERLGAPFVEISALRGAGLRELKTAMARELGAAEELRDTPALTNVRHIELLTRSRAALERAAAAADLSASEEFVLADLQEALRALEELTGRRTSEDLLQHIFQNFCIGK